LRAFQEARNSHERIVVMTTSAREQSALLADLLRREHLALSEFLVALAEFDAERGWV